MPLSSAPLASFLTVLGLRPEANETPDRLSISAQVEGQAVKELDYSVVEQLTGCYGNALTAEFRLESLPELEIGQPDMTPEVFQLKKANFAGGNSYQLGLRIDKRSLLDQVLGSEAARGTIHYFFATSVESLLARGLDELEKTIWGDATEARRLLIGDTDLQRSGPAFQIIGSAGLTALAPLAPLPEPISAAIERIRADREEQISWDHQWVQRLTPVHLQLDGESGDSRLEELLAAAYIQLCLLYTCDRARRRPDGSGGWETQPEYQGGQATVRIPFREAQPIGTRVTGAVAQGFAGLIDWCYRLRDEGTTRDWAADRLQFTQVRVAQVLEPVREADRLITLIGQVADILAALDDQWRAFIEDRFGQYLDKERQLESVVNDVVTTFAEKTTALAKSLSDTLLAAVAVLIGSAIAAAFKSPFNAALFRVGLLAYAGYVLIFPGLYGLGSQVGQFLEIDRTFEYQRKRFNTLLSPEKTNEIIDNRVRRAKTRYWRWFGYTIVGYAIAVAAAIVAAIVVPSIVK